MRRNQIKKKRKRGGTEPCREFGSSYQQPLSLCLSVIYSGSEFIIRARRRNVCPPPPADKPINDFVLSDDNTRSLGGTRKEMQRGIAHERTAGVDVDTRRGILYSSALGNELLILSLSPFSAGERERATGTTMERKIAKKDRAEGGRKEGQQHRRREAYRSVPLLFASSSSFLSIASTSDPMQPVTCILVCSSSSFI